LKVDPSEIKPEQGIKMRRPEEPNKVEPETGEPEMEEPGPEALSMPEKRREEQPGIEMAKPKVKPEQMEPESGVEPEKRRPKEELETEPEKMKRSSTTKEMV
jgi:hypothetical protein